MAAKIKFVKRGGAPAVTIHQDDLAASESIGNVEDLIAIERTQEAEMPKEVQIGYISQDHDYQTGVQHSQRMTGGSINKIGIDVQVVLTANHAKQIADSVLYNAWVSRNMAQLKLNNKYKFIEPTDVILVETDVAVHQYYVLATDDNSNGVIGLQCVPDEASQYISNSEGDGGEFDDQVLYPLAKSRYELLDIALLRDTDEGIGIYVAAAGRNDGWEGAVVFKSSDNGLTYQQLDGVFTASIFGFTRDVLGVGRADIFDETNTLIVRFPYGGELSSTTELAVLNGANALLVGDEVLQFKNAEQLDEGIYEISGLLRGRRGTEWAISTHAEGDRVVLLDFALIRLALPSTDIPQERLYKVVTLNDIIQDTEESSFTFQNVGQECYAPVHAFAVERNATGDVTINWVRRNRLYADWRDYVDVPMSEQTEAYEIDIVDELGELVNTYESTSSTFDYTRALQLSDFGAPSWLQILDNADFDIDGFPDYVIGLTYWNGYLVITTGGISGGSGQVYLWDGTTLTSIFINSTSYLEVFAPTVYAGSLYVGTYYTLTGYADVWRYSGSGIVWTQVGGDGLNSGWPATYDMVRSMIEDGTYLYAGLGASAGGAEVWRWNGTVWEKIGGDGLNSSWNTDYEVVQTMVIMGTTLYVGIGNSANDAEVWSTPVGSISWTKIGGDSVNSSWGAGYERIRSLAQDGTYIYAGLGDSAGDAEVWRWNGTAWTKIGGDSLNGSWASAHEYAYTMTVLSGVLYVGLGESADEGEVWSWNGTSWTKVGGDGVSGGWNGAAFVRALYAHDGVLYAGPGVSSNGTNVWQIQDPSNPVPEVVNFNVYQMSAINGRGYPASGTIIRRT